jgi:DNA-binding NarL/FixJ family response regulator
MIRVLVVDDHPSVRAGLASLMDGTMGVAVVGSVGHGLEVDAALYRLSPDVVLLDDRMPGKRGLAICRAIKRRIDPPAIAIYSGFVREHLTIPALLAGADAVIDKGVDARVLIGVIRDLAEGGRVMPAVSELEVKVAGDAISEADAPVLGMLIDGATSDDIGIAMRLTPKEVGRRFDVMLACLMGQARSG